MTQSKSEAKRFEWTVGLFLILNPIAAIIGLIVLAFTGDWGSPWIWFFGLLFAAATNLSVTAGYHRLFAHRSYEVRAWVEWLFLLVGASAYQGSALKWSSDHRRHHAEVDTEKDPYSIEKGFWYAHMGWLFWKDSVDMPIRAPDLEKNPRVAFQNKHYLALSILVGFLFPMFVGWLMGSAFAGLIIAGSLRIALTQQSTFFVNSLCHTFGKQTYSKEVSARDSLFVAFLTHGEGYHSFHHTFQIDYRNGIRWYHWDPTKWTILMLKWTGMAKKLRTISATEILKARLAAEALRLSSQGFAPETIEQMKAKVIEAQVKWRSLKEDYQTKKAQYRAAGEARVRALRFEIELAKLEFRNARDQWHLFLNSKHLVRVRA